MPDPQEFDDTKLRYTIDECLRVLGVSRKHFYARVKEGRYRTIKDGTRTFMTKEQLVAAARGKRPPPA